MDSGYVFLSEIGSGERRKVSIAAEITMGIVAFWVLSTVLPILYHGITMDGEATFTTKLAITIGAISNERSCKAAIAIFAVCSLLMTKYKDIDPPISKSHLLLFTGVEVGIAYFCIGFAATPNWELTLQLAAGVLTPLSYLKKMLPVIAALIVQYVLVQYYDKYCILSWHDDIVDEAEGESRFQNEEGNAADKTAKNDSNIHTEQSPNSKWSSPAPKFCMYCGKPLQKGWKNCPYCGKKIETGHFTGSSTHKL